MIKEKKVIAIITARGGSKGVPKKNIRTLHEKPLIAWTIESALTSKFLDKVIVTTDCEEIAKTAKKFGSKDITLLYCVSNYPSKVSDFNLNNIKLLKQKFKCRIGLSDHSKDNRVAITAIASGAEIIEKHIALENQKKGLDINFSLKGKEIKKFKEDIVLAYKLLGSKNFFRNKSENTSKILRRSIFAIKDIKKGEKFTLQNIKRIRPGNGLAPKFYELLLKKKSLKNIQRAEPISFKCFKN